jgi:hypothetical protein
MPVKSKRPMGKRSSAFLMALAGAGAVVLAAGAAHAGDGSVRPNYTFPAGLPGFSLVTSGGLVNPGVLVGFNPQPDPPGVNGDGDLVPAVMPTFLNLRDPLRPTLENAGLGDAWSLHFWIQDFGDGSVAPPPAPNSDGVVAFRHVLGDHVFDITFDVGPGQVDPASWVAFNPQPDPPGKGFGVSFNFTGPADPFFAFSIDEDGHALSFSVTPEPATWAVMLAGFGLAGAALRGRRRRLALAA